MSVIVCHPATCRLHCLVFCKDVRTRNSQTASSSLISCIHKLQLSLCAHVSVQYTETLIVRAVGYGVEKKKMRKPLLYLMGTKVKKKKNEGEREKSFCACEYVCVCLCKSVASARDRWRYLLRKERRITIARQSVVCGRGKVGAVVCGMQVRMSPSGSLHHRGEGQVEVKSIFCCSRLRRPISRN